LEESKMSPLRRLFVFEVEFGGGGKGTMAVEALKRSLAAR